MGVTTYDNLAIYLHEMGLSEYESDAYLSLLNWGTAPAKVVSEEADIPQSRVYDVLGKLQKKGLVKVQPGRPKKFGATDPELAVEKYCEYKESQLQSKIEQTRVAGQRFTQEFSPSGCESHEHDASEIFWSYSDETRLLQEFRDLCENSSERIRMVTGVENIRRKLNHHKEILSTRSREGVTIQILLANRDMLNVAVMERLTQCAEIRSMSDMGGQIYLGDMKSVLMAFPDPTTEGYLGLTIKNQDIGYTLSQLFDAFWRMNDEQIQSTDVTQQIE